MEVAKLWRGTEGSSVLITDENIATDYELACQTRNYAQLLNENIDRILVIGDLPEQITWKAISSEEGVFVKWIGADSDDQIMSAFPNILVQQFTELPISFLVESESLLVFDSACKLDELGENFLVADLIPGSYSVSYLNYEPDESLILNVIRLHRI